MPAPERPARYGVMPMFSNKYAVLPGSLTLIVVGIIITTMGIGNNEGHVYLAFVGPVCIIAGSMMIFRLILNHFRQRFHAATQTNTTVSQNGLPENGNAPHPIYDDDPPAYDVALSSPRPSITSWALDNPGLELHPETNPTDFSEPPPPYDEVKHIHTGEISSPKEIGFPAPPFSPSSPIPDDEIDNMESTNL